MTTLITDLEIKIKQLERETANALADCDYDYENRKYNNIYVKLDNHREAIDLLKLAEDLLK